MEKAMEYLKTTPSTRKSMKKCMKEHEFKPGQATFDMNMMITIIIAGSIDDILPSS
jgi:hypothetical protein